jgi:hypothetical protein
MQAENKRREGRVTIMGNVQSRKALPLSSLVWGKVGKSNKVEPYELAGTPLIYGTDSTFGKYCR